MYHTDNPTRIVHAPSGATLTQIVNNNNVKLQSSRSQQIDQIKPLIHKRSKPKINVPTEIETKKNQSTTPGSHNTISPLGINWTTPSQVQKEQNKKIQQHFFTDSKEKSTIELAQHIPSNASTLNKNHTHKIHPSKMAGHQKCLNNIKSQQKHTNTSGSNYKRNEKYPKSASKLKMRRKTKSTTSSKNIDDEKKYLHLHQCEMFSALQVKFGTKVYRHENGLDMFYRAFVNCKSKYDMNKKLFTGTYRCFCSSSDTYVLPMNHDIIHYVCKDLVTYWKVSMNDITRMRKKHLLNQKEADSKMRWFEHKYRSEILSTTNQSKIVNPNSPHHDNTNQDINGSEIIDNDEKKLPAIMKTKTSTSHLDQNSSSCDSNQSEKSSSTSKQVNKTNHNNNNKMLDIKNVKEVEKGFIGVDMNKIRIKNGNYFIHEDTLKTLVTENNIVETAKSKKQKRFDLTNKLLKKIKAPFKRDHIFQVFCSKQKKTEHDIVFKYCTNESEDDFVDENAHPDDIVFHCIMKDHQNYTIKFKSLRIMLDILTHNKEENKHYTELPCYEYKLVMKPSKNRRGGRRKRKRKDNGTINNNNDVNKNKSNNKPSNFYSKSLLNSNTNHSTISSNSENMISLGSNPSKHV